MISANIKTILMIIITRYISLLHKNLLSLYLCNGTTPSAIAIGMENASEITHINAIMIFDI